MPISHSRQEKEANNTFAKKVIRIQQRKSLSINPRKMKAVVNGLLIVSISLICCAITVEVELQQPSIRLSAEGPGIERINEFETVVNSGISYSFQCDAEYPVQIIYKGGGAPEFTLKTTNGKQNEERRFYSSDLTVLKASESHTGEYRCQNLEFPMVYKSLYIYVPGNALFVPSMGKTLVYGKNDKYLTIPCTVSRKNATVSLQKSVRDVLQPSVKDYEEYDPMKGFSINLENSEDIGGVYVCTASYSNLFRVIEYTVISEDVFKQNMSVCTASSCGKNAECNIISNRAICNCAESFQGNPYQVCFRKCKTNTDCSALSYCNAKSESCEDPCKNYPCDQTFSECSVVNHTPICIKKDRVLPRICGQKSCGNGKTCSQINGQNVCSCGEGFTSEETDSEEDCVPKCTKHSDCPLSKICDYPVCVNTCDKFNPCGIMANCRIQRHQLICKCPNGFTGDPMLQCTPPTKITFSQIAKNASTYSEPIIRRSCNDTNCGNFATCFTRDGQDPLCTCQAGYFGTPPNCQLRKILPSFTNCSSHESCPGSLACVDSKCINPCTIHSSCQDLNSRCMVVNHAVRCTCMEGFYKNRDQICVSVSKISQAVLVPSYAQRCPIVLCGNVRRNPLNPPIRPMNYPTQQKLLILN